MTVLAQTVVFGVLVGGVYALFATGLTLIFGVMKIVNMAHGAFLVLSAYLCYSVSRHAGIDPLVAALAVAPVMAALGYALYRLIIERAQRIDQGLAIVATFGVAILAEGVIALIWGPDPSSSTPSYFNQAFHLGGVSVPKAQLYAAAVALAVTAGLQVLVKRTWLGHAIVAASENPEGARLVGVDPARVGAAVFALAVGTTAFGGAALSFLYQFTPDSQDDWIGLTLSVVILGGLGSIVGAVAGGLLLGLAEAFTSAYLSVRWATAVPLLMILVVLTVRPEGLLSSRTREDLAT